MLDFQILWISKVINMEEILYLFYTILCKRNDFVLLIYDKVSSFFLLDTHNSINL